VLYSSGTALEDEVGGLVLPEPMPSLPVFLWGDRENHRYLESYFSTYARVWLHGDRVRVRPDGGVASFGRFDSTRNRHGMRLWTSGTPRVLEEMGGSDTAWSPISPSRKEARA
jgi:acetoacetyl-CoA synthetase